MSDFENTYNPEEMDEPTIVTLLDEDGGEHEFEHVDSFPFNGETYVVLIPTEEEIAEGEADEILFFTLQTDEEGNEALSFVEDEAELDMVYEEFKNRMQDEFDFEE
ncbi:MAG: DUF1292 domain-containing protein [Ruminococcaceae bacterium]|nr:DUF1292 domain-containing protein [Oscillospiraceae bacterium]